MVPCPDVKFPDARVVDSEVDSAADLELCQTMVWSDRQPTGAANGALRAELPAGTCLVTTNEAGAPAIHVAAPRDLFVLPSAGSPPTASFPPLAPGSVVTRVKSGARATDNSAEAAAAADADLAELAAALRRARAQEVAS